MDRTRRSRTATGVNSVEVLEAKLHAIYQQSLIFMGILDLDGRLLDANQLAYDVCGVHPEEVIGKRFWDTDWWRGSKHSQACIKKAVASAARGEVYRADLHYTRATGGEYVVDFVMSPVRSSTGKVLFLAPLGMDITERKRAEAELARLNSHLEKRSAQRTAELIESQARLQAVTSSIHDGLVITDLDDVIQDINPRMQTLLGYSREEALGKRVYELFLPPGEAAKIREQSRERARGKSSTYEVMMRKKNGTTFPCEISGSPLRNSEGVVTGTIGVTRDITERKSMEEALRAEQRLAATGRMAAGIAHEINNPLNGIRNCFQLVKDAIPKGHQAVRYGRLIEKEIDRMAGIIKQMFTLYGNQGSVPTAVDIRELMGEITDLHSPEVHSKGMRLRVAIGQGLAPAFAPRGALTEALHNLIRNAIDASTSCRGTISIMAKELNSRIRIRVSDEGEGIPPELADRVFEPFFTTKTTAGSGGMGLGLAMTRSHVEAMNGRIWFEPNSPRGTTFHLELPKGLRENVGRTGRRIHKPTPSK